MGTVHNKIIAWWHHKEGKVKSDTGIDRKGLWERQLEMGDTEVVWGDNVVSEQAPQCHCKMLWFQ